MTTAQNSVVTPERFAQGRDWSDYIDFIGSPENLERAGPRGGPRDDNSEHFHRNIEQFTLRPHHIASLKALPKYKVLAIGEDWCPDVYRGLPVIAAVCAAAGWELRLFQRDQNEDMAAEFPNIKDGQSFNSIPVIAFYTQDGFTEVARWIERPKVADETISAIAKEFTRQDGESDDDMRVRLRARYQTLQTSDQWDDWRHASIDEWLALLTA